MPKVLTILLTTTPYTFQNTHTALRLIDAALGKGYQVNLFASGDGVHNFTVGQKAKGVPNAQEGFQTLIAKGLHVELCGTCLHFRGIKREALLDGAEPSAMNKLFALVKQSDAFITLGF